LEGVQRQNEIEVEGVHTRYLTAGSGPPVLFLHGIGESAIDWQWLMPAFADRFELYAPDLPGTTQLGHPNADYSPDRVARFVVFFLTLQQVERAIVVGSSFGGLVGLYMALEYPQRVGALGLVSSAGLGKTINPIMRLLSLPGYGGWGALWGQTPFGAMQRAWLRALLLFAHPQRAPLGWLEEQYRLARLPTFLQTTVEVLQSQVSPAGQRHILLEHLFELRIPVLVAWGQQDRVLPVEHARQAIRRLRTGHMEVIANCGHLPHVEHPMQFAAVLDRFISDQVRLF